MEKSEVTFENAFHPNRLTQEEIQNLDGWKLKVATMHFGKGRGDCVQIGYCYQYFRNSIFSDRASIHVVGDKDGLWKNPIDLETEIDWDSDKDLLRELGTSPEKLMKEYISEQVTEWFQEIE